MRMGLRIHPALYDARAASIFGPCLSSFVIRRLFVWRGSTSGRLNIFTVTVVVVALGCSLYSCLSFPAAS